MRYLTTLLSCLMALFGCQEKATSTSITRVSEQGVDLLFSRTSVGTGSASFECVRSASGRCYYEVFEEACDAARHCVRAGLQRFDVRAGQLQRQQGLPAGFQSCVSSRPEQRCHRG